MADTGLSPPGVQSSAGKTPRVSQRAPTSCSFCYRRKIKCTKVFPCAPCVSRGIADRCELEPVVVKGNLVAPPPKKRELSADELAIENVALQRKLRQQDRLIASLQRDLDRSPEIKLESTLAPPSPPPPKLPSPAALIQDREHAILATDFEVLGMPSLPISPIVSDPTAYHLHPSPLSWQPPWLATNPSVVQSFLSFVPGPDQSTFLLEAHLNLLSYIHCVVHGPTLRLEHRRWIESLQRGEGALMPKWDWLALYFAIIASALYHIDDHTAIQHGFTSAQVSTLPRRWFDLSVDALHRSDYMSNPTLASIQAICVLPMIGYTFGASGYIRWLLHSAIHSAQMLNFHLLGPEGPEMPLVGQIHRELGRRCWFCLVVSEWMALAFSQNILLVHNPSRSALPANINDEQLSDMRRIKPLPLSTPTLVSHLLAMSRTADLCRLFSQAFHAPDAVRDVEKQYAVVLEHDRKLLRILDFCPALRPNDDPYPAEVDPTRPFDYLPWARYIWATIIPPFRIRWYRHFLGRSFSDARFSGARETCLEAARQLIKERRRRIPPLFRKAWHVSAHTVLAGMVLATECVHGSSNVERRRQLRLEILEVVEMLRESVQQGGSSDTILPRGIGLITHLIGEDLQAPSAAAVEGVSVELPPEMLWPTLELDAGFEDWLLRSDTETQMWNPDGTFNLDFWELQNGPRMPL